MCNCALVLFTGRLGFNFGRPETTGPEYFTQKMGRVGQAVSFWPMHDYS